MAGRFRMLRQLILELPRNLKLAYCLAYDPRVPVVNKVALATVLTLIVTPFIDIPDWIPVVGELNILALTVLATHLFIATADPQLVAEQEHLIAARRSRFDADVDAGKRVAMVISTRFNGSHDKVTGADVDGRSGAPARAPGNQGMRL
jgi:uncharacterized membrane protein YkvA (DUF1232 family)